MINNYLPSGKNITPFNPTLEHFDLICGHLISVNKVYKFIAIISVLAFFVSIGISMYAISQPDSIPVIVTMNDFGEAHYVGPVTRQNWQHYNIPENAVTYQVKNFIDLYYSMSTDGIVMKKNVNKTYHVLTAITAQKYARYIKDEDPFLDFGSKTREVQFDTEPLNLSNNTYQIDFKIITKNLEGYITSSLPYRAIITTKTLQPNEEDLKDNPLGIYITAFDMKPLNITENKQK